MHPPEKRTTPTGTALRWRWTLLPLLAATQIHAQDLLIIGIGADQRNWDGMGKVVFFLESINGDAVPEIVATAHCADCHGTNSGTIQVFNGVPEGLTGKHELLWQRYGDSARDRLGEAAAPCGDLDGDGITDIIVGAPGDRDAGTRVGSVYLLSGIDGSEIYRFWGSGPRGRFGATVAQLDDLDGDGIGEFAIGAPDDTGVGSVTVIAGGNGEVLARYWGETDSRFGTAIGSAGDISKDGVGDLLIGAPAWDGGRGKGLVLDGDAVARGISDLSAVTLAEIDGNNPLSYLGRSMSANGDLDQDGAREIAGGAPGDDTIFLYSGATGELLDTLEGRGRDGGDVDGFGYTTVVTTGDVNADGIDDFAVGAPGYAAAAQDNVGIVYLYSGRDRSILRTSQKYVDEDDYFGASLGAGGTDFDGDGRPDIVIGIPGYGDRAAGNAFGAVYVDLS